MKLTLPLFAIAAVLLTGNGAWGKDILADEAGSIRGGSGSHGDASAGNQDIAELRALLEQKDVQIAELLEAGHQVEQATSSKDNHDNNDSSQVIPFDQISAAGRASEQGARRLPGATCDPKKKKDNGCPKGEFCGNDKKCKKRKKGIATQRDRKAGRPQKEKGNKAGGGGKVDSAEVFDVTYKGKEVKLNVFADVIDIGDVELRFAHIVSVTCAKGPVAAKTATKAGVKKAPVKQVWIMNIDAFVEEGQLLKMPTHALTHPDMDDCLDAKEDIIEGLIGTDNCIPGGYPIYDRFSESTKHPIFCDNWCTKQFAAAGVTHEDFKPPEKGALFWGSDANGAAANSGAAKAYAKATGLECLESTAGGVALETAPLWAGPWEVTRAIPGTGKSPWMSSISQTAYLWGCASKSIAQHAGEMSAKSDTFEIHVFQEKGKGETEYGSTIPIWYNIELPTLYTENPKATLQFHWRNGAAGAFNGKVNDIADMSKVLRENPDLATVKASLVLNAFYIANAAYPKYGAWSSEEYAEAVETMVESMKKVQEVEKVKALEIFTKAKLAESRKKFAELLNFHNKEIEKCTQADKGKGKC